MKYAFPYHPEPPHPVPAVCSWQRRTFSQALLLPHHPDNRHHRNLHLLHRSVSYNSETYPLHPCLRVSFIKIFLEYSLYRLTVISLSENTGSDSDDCRTFLYCHRIISSHSHGKYAHRNIINVFISDVNS